MRTTTKNLYEYLKENASYKKDCRFFFDDERSYSSNEVFFHTIHTANDLYKMGIKRGDLIALRATRSIDTAILFYAIQILGAVAILCDPHNKVCDVLKESKVTIEPKIIITNENSNKDVAAYGKWVIKDKDYYNKGILFIDGKEDETAPLFDTDIDVKKPALIIFTSGSTGKNKAVMLSQYNYLNHIMNYYEQGNYETDDIGIGTLPVFHVFGLAVVIMSLIRKHEYYFPSTTDVTYVAEKIKEHRITRLDGVPSYAYKLAKYYEENNIQVNTLRVGVLGGAPSSKEQFDYIEKTLNIKLLPAYGMSECIVITAAGKKYNDEKRSSSVGTKLPLCDLRILDENGKEVKKGETGEITASGPMIMLGYYNDIEETNKAIIGGRLHTGDLGYLDKDDFLHIVGRKKDIIIRNGNNISSVKLEQKIELLNEVYSCVVVGIPSDACGEVPAAMVKLENNTAISEEKLKKETEKILAKNEVLEVLKIVDDFPLLATGKVDKKKVREILMKG